MVDRRRGADADEFVAGCDQEFTAGRAAFQTAIKQTRNQVRPDQGQTQSPGLVILRFNLSALYREKPIAVKFLSCHPDPAPVLATLEWIR
jgi:hypothetical protein